MQFRKYNCLCSYKNNFKSNNLMFYTVKYWSHDNIQYTMFNAFVDINIVL